MPHTEQGVEAELTRVWLDGGLAVQKLRTRFSSLSKLVPRNGALENDSYTFAEADGVFYRFVPCRASTKWADVATTMSLMPSLYGK